MPKSLSLSLFLSPPPPAHWCTHVILATWEVERWRLRFEARPHINGKKMDVVVHMTTQRQWEA
jgi:hypothetical protein